MAAEGDDLQRAYRRFVLEHHPDRGGDPERFRAGLEDFRRRLRRSTVRPPGRAGGPPPGGTSGRGPRPGARPVVVHRRPSVTTALGETVAGALHRVLGRLGSTGGRRPRPPASHPRVR